MEGGGPMAKLSAKDEEFLTLEDNRLDKRLIEGILTDRDSTIQSIREQYDVSEAGVLRRASELGLSEAMLRHAKGVAADLAGDPSTKRLGKHQMAARSCLSCDRVFLSTGPGNRLCSRCRGVSAGLASL